MPHQWSEDDEIIALDAYFCASEFSLQDECILYAAMQIGCTPESVHLRLMDFRQLNQKDSQSFDTISAQSRRIWECYGHDRKLVHKQARNILKRRTPPKKISRREARQGVMQIMYSSLLQDISAADALENLQKVQTSPRDKAVFTDDLLLHLAAALDKQREEIFCLTTDATGRAHERISYVERAIIYTAVAELLSYPQTDTNIIITEAVQIAKQYGAEGGYKIVNGTLDQIVHKCKTARA